MTPNDYKREQDYLRTMTNSSSVPPEPAWVGWFWITALVIVVGFFVVKGIYDWGYQDGYTYGRELWSHQPAEVTATPAPSPTPRPTSIIRNR